MILFLRGHNSPKPDSLQWLISKLPENAAHHRVINEGTPHPVPVASHAPAVLLPGDGSCSLVGWGRRAHSSFGVEEAAPAVLSLTLWYTHVVAVQKKLILTPRISEGTGIRLILLIALILLAACPWLLDAGRFIHCSE